MRNWKPFGLVFLFSIPVCHFGEYFAYVLGCRISGLDELEPTMQSEQFSLFLDHSLRNWILFLGRTSAGVLIAMWLIRRRLRSLSPKKVFYMEIPALVLAYLIYRAGFAFIVALMAPGLDHMEPSKIVLIFLPIFLSIFVFALLWLVAITLILSKLNRKEFAPGRVPEECR